MGNASVYVVANDKNDLFNGGLNVVIPVVKKGFCHCEKTINFFKILT